MLIINTKSKYDSTTFYSLKNNRVKHWIRRPWILKTTDANGGRRRQTLLQSINNRNKKWIIYQWRQLKII